MSWVAHLVRTMDGRRGRQLQLAGAGSWSIPLNGIEDFSVIVSKEELRLLDPAWWSHHRTSVAVSWQHEDGRLDAWVAGPIMGPPAESRSTATLSCKGIGVLLEKRVLLDHEYTIPEDMKTLAQSVVARAGMSLGTIAQDIVQCALAKTGGYLPIVPASPRETGAGLNERTYRGYNLANNQVWKRLTELTNVRGGPDIAFRPAWRDGMLVWELHHGTRAQPTIAQAWTMDLDTTSSTSPVASVNVTTDAGQVTNRVYWTGAGEDEGTLIRVVEDRSLLVDQMPLLETVGSTSDTDNPALLLEHARAQLDAGRAPVTQISVKVDGADPRSEIGRWRVGDAARLTLGGEWLTVPKGTRSMRVISAKGSWTSAMVDLEFQSDAPETFEEEVVDDGAAP